jgi:arylamine N-acetyltransferase
VCSQTTPDGRITVADRRLILTRNGTREEQLLASDEERSAALKQYLKIVF